MTPSPRKAAKRSSPPATTKLEERNRLVERTAHQLSRDIMGGTYEPGEHIRETEVSERLGVSRAPVREALNILKHEGMVEIIPWRGARVINPSPNEIADLFDLLAAIEGVVAKLAVRNASDAELSRYADKVGEAAKLAGRRQRDDFFDVVHAAYQAAEILAASCGSPMAASIVRTVGKPAYWLHRFLMPATAGWIQKSLTRQAALRDALLARDEDRSERAARALVRHTRRLVVLHARSVSRAQNTQHRVSSWRVGDAGNASPARERPPRHR